MRVKGKGRGRPLSKGISTEPKPLINACGPVGFSPVRPYHILEKTMALQVVPLCVVHGRLVDRFWGLTHWDGHPARGRFYALAEATGGDRQGLACWALEALRRSIGGGRHLSPATLRKALGECHRTLWAANQEVPPEGRAGVSLLCLLVRDAEVVAAGCGHLLLVGWSRYGLHPLMPTPASPLGLTPELRPTTAYQGLEPGEALLAVVGPRAGSLPHGALEAALSSPVEGARRRLSLLFRSEHSLTALLIAHP